MRPDALPDRAEVIVIGGGPAGASASALLAEAGHEVVLLERERFPRYRIGESLIPHCWFALDRLGVVEALDRAGFMVHKHSVQFAGLDGEISAPFYFFEHEDHPSSRTWQVWRSEFDVLLLENAKSKGVRVLQPAAARSLIQQDERVVGVRALDDEGQEFEVRAPMVLDASGRDAFAMTRNRWRVPDPDLRKIALWTYYEGTLREQGLDAGATTIAYLPEKSWFWHLPLANDRVSVGIVAEAPYLYREGKDLAAIFEREVQLQPWIARHLAVGRRIEDFRVTGEFTYRSRYCACDGLLLTGDAFGFLDPVFSSGVYLALQGGVLAADAIHAALEAGDTSGARFEDYSTRVCHATEAMRRLVFAFYDDGFSFGKFFKAHPEHRSKVTDCLIGKLDGDFDPLFRDVARFAAIPKPLEHGRPCP